MPISNLPISNLPISNLPISTTPSLRLPRFLDDQRGQATTEYALVLLGAAAVALLFLAWATRTGAIGSLLDTVLNSIKSKI